MPGRRDVFVDARERAPLAATRDMFLDAQGNANRKLSVDGALAAGKDADEHEDEVAWIDIPVA